MCSLQSVPPYGLLSTSCFCPSYTIPLPFDAIYMCTLFIYLHGTLETTNEKKIIPCLSFWDWPSSLDMVASSGIHFSPRRMMSWWLLFQTSLPWDSYSARPHTEEQQPGSQSAWWVSNTDSSPAVQPSENLAFLLVLTQGMRWRSTWETSVQGCGNTDVLIQGKTHSICTRILVMPLYKVSWFFF